MVDRPEFWRAMDDTDLGQEIARIHDQLAKLDVERAHLALQLTRLECGRQPTPAQPPPEITVRPARSAMTAASPAAQKIDLFRRLFAGRSDVFPVHWENTRTKRSGCAPACANEWVKDTCGKPQVKCGECSNQAFIPVSDAVIARHLGGNGAAHGADRRGFVMGVYPLLSDETCRFLAADFDGAS